MELNGLRINRSSIHLGVWWVKHNSFLYYGSWLGRNQIRGRWIKNKSLFSCGAYWVKRSSILGFGGLSIKASSIMALDWLGTKA